MNFKSWINESNNKTLSGWLAPNGKFYECKRAIFDHLHVVETNAEIKRLMPSWFEEKLKRLKNLQKELEKTENHPEWHSYDAMKDSIEISVYDEMYKKGFLRVASHSGEVYFEGTSSGISSLYNKAKDLAEQSDMKAVFMKVSF